LAHSVYNNRAYIRGDRCHNWLEQSSRWQSPVGCSIKHAYIVYTWGDHRGDRDNSLMYTLYAPVVRRSPPVYTACNILSITQSYWNNRLSYPFLTHMWIIYTQLLINSTNNVNFKWLSMKRKTSITCRHWSIVAIYR